MASYRKFNNSRSSKHPFWVYLKIEDYKCKSPDGSSWSAPGSDAVEITKEEYETVAKSYEETANPEVGDHVVVIEFCPAKKRYSTVKYKYEFGTGTENVHQRVLLDNGDNYAVRDVRKSTVLHKS